MLVLTRKSGEDIFLGDDIRVVVREIKGRQVRIGIEAPAFVPVYRGEIYRQIQEENRRAAAGDMDAAGSAAASIRRLILEKEGRQGE